MRYKSQLYLMISILIGLSMAITGCSSGMPFQPTPTAEIPEQEDITPLVSATGMVVPMQWTTLSMNTNGVIEDLFVGEGDFVEKGTLLVRLNGSEALKASVSAAQVELIAAQQALDDLDETADNRRSTALLALAEAEKAFDKATDNRQSKEFQNGDLDDIEIAYANYIMAEQKVKDAQKDFDEQASWRNEDDLIRANFLSRLAAARDERDDTLRRYNYLKSLPDDFDLAISDGELEVAKTNLEEAKRDWENVKDTGIHPKDMELAEARLLNATNQLDAAQAALADLELKAPFSGTISRLDVHTNEWVAIGQSVMLLADVQHLVVETTDLNEIDAAQVDLGDQVIVTFDALPENSVRGKVYFIAPKSDGAGVNYKVKIELNEIPPKLRWGMTAFVDIEIND